MPAVSFADACALLESALGPASAARSSRASRPSHDFTAGAAAAACRHARPRLEGRRAKIELDEAVGKYDRRTRQDGFHVLNDWDGKADHVNDDIIPVDVLDYLIARRGTEPLDAAVARDPARLLLLPPPHAALAADLGRGRSRRQPRSARRDPRPAAGLGRQRPAVRRRCGDADPDRDVAFRDPRARLRDAAGARANAQRARIASASPSRTPSAWAATCASASRRPTAATRW